MLRNRTEIRKEVKEHIIPLLEALANYDIGYWPDDSEELLTDAIMVLLDQQHAIDEQHVKERTNFAN